MRKNSTRISIKGRIMHRIGLEEILRNALPGDIDSHPGQVPATPDHWGLSSGSFSPRANRQMSLIM